MLENKEFESNNFPQSEDVLNQENAPKKQGDFPLWKRAVLLAIGSIGLELIAIIVTFVALGIPKSDRSGAVNLITYSILVVALVGLIASDVTKFIPRFKKWQPYVFGIAFGVGIIITDNAYLNFIDLLYTSSVSVNETNIRSVIDIFPVASVFIFGLVGPLCEELTYRVGLFGLPRKFNRILAYAVSALVFGFLHFTFTATDIVKEFLLLPSYIGSGVALAAAYDLFDLPCSWTAHSINNLWAIITHIIITRM